MPDRTFQSPGATEAAWTAINTSSSAGTGSGMSVYASTSGPP